MMKKKNGAIALFFAFLITALLIIVIAAVLAPMGILLNSEMYKAGEMIMLEANSSIQGINDTGVRTNVTAATQAGFDNIQYTMEINADLFQYSWIFILVITGIMVFLATRYIVEFQTGGFV